MLEITLFKIHVFFAVHLGFVYDSVDLRVEMLLKVLRRKINNYLKILFFQVKSNIYLEVQS